MIGGESSNDGSEGCATSRKSQNSNPDQTQKEVEVEVKSSNPQL